MATVRGSDPVELRVLSALTAGASTAMGVSAEVGEPESLVAPILEGSVAEETAVRLDLPGLPTYALTPKGLALLGVSQGAQDDAGEVDLAGAPRMPLEQPEAARDVATDEPLRERAGRPGDDVTRDPAPADLPPVAPTGIGPSTASGGTSTAIVPAPTVRWRHVAYAVAYVVLGLVLLAISPILGGLSIVAGLVLGGYTLRPLFATSRTRVSDR